MQQIGMTGRFWWRALDAPAPRPPVSRASAATTPGAWAYPVRRPVKSVAKTNSAKLAVARDQRRPAACRHSNFRFSSIAVLAAFATVASASCFGLLLSGKFEDLRTGLGLAQQASAALMAAGFGIDQVSVSGHRFTPDADVYDAIDLPNAKTFAEFNAAAALKRIERLPWVDNAQITRMFPGSLAVQIRERRPAAIWSRAGNSYLIDATGRVLGPIASTTSWALPRITGEGANTEAAMLFLALSRYPDLEQNFSHGERIAERRWSAVFKNGSRLEMAADREAEGLETLHANKELARALLAETVIADVRTPGRPVIRPFKPAVQPAAAGPVAEVQP